MSDGQNRFGQKARIGGIRRHLIFRQEDEWKKAELFNTIRSWRVENRLPIVEEYLDQCLSKNTHPYKDMERSRFSRYLAEKFPSHLLASLNKSAKENVRLIRSDHGRIDPEDDIRILARIAVDNLCTRNIRLMAVESLLGALAFPGNSVAQTLDRMGLIVTGLEQAGDDAISLIQGSFLARLSGRRRLRSLAARILDQLEEPY